MPDVPSRVSFSELEDNDDGLYAYNNIPYTGVVYREEHGVLRYQQPYKDGLPCGQGYVWGSDGKLRISQSYHQGALHGVKREQDETETVVLEEIFEFGVLLLRKRVDESGEMVETFRLTKNDPGFATLTALRSMYPDDILAIEAVPSDLKRNRDEHS